jgi:hypothetical protein
MPLSAASSRLPPPTGTGGGHVNEWGNGIIDKAIDDLIEFASKP